MAINDATNYKNRSQSIGDYSRTLTEEQSYSCQLEAIITERLKRRGLKLYGWILQQGYNQTQFSNLIGITRPTLNRWITTGKIPIEGITQMVRVGVPEALFILQ